MECNFTRYETWDTKLVPTVEIMALICEVTSYPLNQSIAQMRSVNHSSECASLIITANYFKMIVP